MSNFDEIVTDRRLNLTRCQEQLKLVANGGGDLDDLYKVTTSGGSSGSRSLVVLNFRETALLWANFGRSLHRWRCLSGASFRNPVIAGITTGSRLFRSQQGLRIFKDAESHIFSINADLDELVTGLNRVRPDFLMLYPSIIPNLIMEVERQHLRISPSLIISVAEPLLPEHEAAISRVWKSPVINIWGASEVGVLAAGSGFESGLLLLEDQAIIEPVDKAGIPVKPGQRVEKLYVTPLFRSTLPLLRYELTDQFVLRAERPICGSVFQMISNVEGRLDDWLVYGPGVEVQPEVIKSILRREPALLEYQVHQIPNGVRVLFTSRELIDLEKLRTSLTTSLRPIMSTEPIVTFERVDQILRTGDACKLKRFVPIKSSATIQAYHS